MTCKKLSKMAPFFADRPVEMNRITYARSLRKRETLVE